MSTLRVGLLCGGPSLERGISLNSARSVMDHLESDDIEIVPIYFDSKKNPYQISKAQLYSNTPSDFDFKLTQTATPLTEKTLVRLLKKTDIVFPAMHGAFGEDGGVQALLEKHKLPFVGSSAAACVKAFDKFNANEYLKQNGFFTLPSVVLQKHRPAEHKKIIERFFTEHSVARAIVKPAKGGSSIGVFSVSNAREALEKVRFIFAERMDSRVVIEPFATGVEFTMVLLADSAEAPVALPPTEIETDYTEHQIFDFRKKYLPTNHVVSHCPPRFDEATIDAIQTQGEKLFALFGMRDFARFDGWVLPSGEIWFCDFNPMSGMEQNSFLFQQAGRIGMTHSDVLRYIVAGACRRQDISFPKIVASKVLTRTEVRVLMGGPTSERQVSLMSGTNVWLKLRHSKKYAPHAYLLDTHGAVWRVPYHLCLYHTVEEVVTNCENDQKAAMKLVARETSARTRLGLGPKDAQEFFAPRKMTLDAFVADASFVFLALHGGDGENGNMQKLLTAHGIQFNGPDERASRLCVDKWDTSRFIDSLHIKGVSAIVGVIMDTHMILAYSDADIVSLWKKTTKELRTKTLIVKPRADGCTTGIVHLFSAKDLRKYMSFIKQKVSFVPKNTFTGQADIIEMPTETPAGLLFETFVETDILRVKANALKHARKNGWVEITIGVVEMSGALHAFYPSITIAEGEVLTVEEKFQGGTGVNLTPPPLAIMNPRAVSKIKKSMEILAHKVGIRGYCRIDAFAHVDTGDLQIIEINTLPGLTPSTVLYQQALAEKTPLFPKELLELLVGNGGR